MKELNKLTKEELIREIKRLRMKEKKPADVYSHYKRLGELAHDSIILNNENGEIIEANGSACRNLGYTYEELLSMNIGDIDEGYNSNEFSNFWKNKPVEKQYLFETKHRRKDGTVFPVEISATAFIENGQKFITGTARDISKRIETEASGLKAKAQLTSAMKIAQLGYWEYDVQEDYFIFDDQFYSIFRTTAEKEGGYKMRPEEYAKKFLHPDDQKIIAEEMKNALETKDPDYSRQIEHRIIYSDGLVGYINVRFFIVKDDTGKTIKTYGANQDITDRKKIELAVMESEKRLFNILNNLQGMAYKCKNDEYWTMEYISAGCKTLTGYNVDELIDSKSLPFNEIIHPDYRNKVWNKVQKALHQKKQYSIEYKIITKDKKEKWVMDRGSANFDDKGNVMDLEGLLTDITRLKETEQELIILSKAVDQAPALIVITDKSGNIEYVNPKFSEVTGYTFDEAIKQDFRFLNSDKQSELIYEEVWKTILSGRAWSGELISKKKNEELYWENALVSPITNPEGKITHFIAIMEDITSKKQTEFELIRAKEKAEESDRLKSAFLANMSHEIRTPMNGIIGFSSLLTGKNLSKEVAEYYKSLIIKSSNQLLIIVNNIIEISKIESGQVHLNLGKVDLKNLLKEVSSEFSYFAKEKGLDFRFGLQLPDEYTTIVTDELKIRLTISNLLNNALKFTKNGFIELGAKYNPKEIHIYIKDSGIGIRKSMQDKIFQRFRQAEETHTREYGGTGLGLSISKAYVEMLDGKIWIESNIGEGTTFYFSVPFKPGSKKEKKQVSQKKIKI
ncbi:MAG: PAS domain S-box protein [Bacteroidales bacterium]|nr:PAS domain S-box protein [Bacteroidales bacterium]